MTSAAVWCLAAAAALAADPAEVAVHIAPDHPLSLVYVDDPLVVEFAGPPGTVVEGVVTIGKDPAEDAQTDAEPFTDGLAPQEILPGGVCWRVIENAPRAAGRYTATFRLRAGDGEPAVTTARYHRVARPLGVEPARVWVRAPRMSRLAALAVEGVPMRRVVLPASMPELDATLERLAERDLEVLLAIDVRAHADAPGFAEDAAAVAGDRVAGWLVHPRGDRALLDRTRAALEPAGGALYVALDSLAQWDAFAMTPGAAGLVVAAGDGANGPDHSASAVFRPSPLAPVLPPGRPADEQHALALFAAGAYAVIIDHGWLYTETDDNEDDNAARHIELDPTYPWWVGMTHRIGAARALEPADGRSPAAGLLMRRADGWLLALYDTPGAADAFTVDAGDATGLRLTDRNNNPLPFEARGDGALAVPADGGTVYLSGAGGGVVTGRSWALAQAHAEALLADAARAEALPEAVRTRLTALTRQDEPSADRREFLEMLRLFPVLEEQRGTELEAGVAVATAERLARVALALCTVEGQAGEPFLSPLQATLTDVRDMQAEYVTGPGAQPDESPRGKWLLDEVGRLAGLAETLANEGAEREAQAVAALAKWRAAALPYAARGPYAR